MKKCIIYSLFIATIVTLASCGVQTVKVQDYIEVMYSPSYNEYAEPELVIDTDGLNALMDSKKTIKYIKSLMNFDEEYKELVDEVVEALEEDQDMLPEFTDFFEIDFADDYDNLKNGDKVRVVIELESSLADITDASVKDVSKKLGLELSKTEIEFKVKGLEDLKTVDVDISKLLIIDFGKYEGYASPSIEIDYGYFRSLLIDEVVDDFAEKSKNSQVQAMLARDCKEWFSAKFDKAYSNLKNGDVIKVGLVLDNVFADSGISFADFEAGLALNFNGSTNTYVVDGLVEPKNVIDIFEGIEQHIVYEGANGRGRIGNKQIEIPEDYSRQEGDIYFSNGFWSNSVKIVHNNTKIGEITYYIEGENLSGGDVLEITASCPTDVLEKLGYIVPTTKTNVTVPDLGEYLTSQEQLTPDIIEAIKTEIYGKEDVKTIDKLYYANYRPGVECTFESTSFVVAIVYRSMWSGGYCIDQLNDIIIKSDGTVVIENYDEDLWGDKTIEKAESKLDVMRYNFVELE